MYNLRCVKTSFGYSKISVTSTSCQKEAGFHHFHGNDADFCPFDDLALPTPGVRQRGVGAGDGMLQENWNPDKTGKYQKLMRQSGRQRTGRASCPEGIWSKEQNYKVRYKPGLDAPHSEGRKTHPIKAKQRNLLSAWSKEHHRCAQHLPPPGAGLLPPNSALELNSGVSPGVLPEMGTTCLQLVLGWDVKQRKYSTFFPHRFVFSPPPAPLGCFLSLAVLQPCPQCHCSADVLQSDSAGAQHVCAQQAGSPFFRQLCEGKHFPLPLFPPHYNSEIYLLPLCPPSSRLCWESLIAALS